MAADVRINNVSTDVTVTDASAMLTPQVLDRIVQAVLQRLAEQQRLEQDLAQERGLSSRRQPSPYR
jgi:hypothetical protein